MFLPKEAGFVCCGGVGLDQQRVGQEAHHGVEVVGLFAAVVFVQGDDEQGHDPRKKARNHSAGLSIPGVALRATWRGDMVGQQTFPMR